MAYLTFFLISALISFLCTVLIRRIALQYDVVDYVEKDPKKKQHGTARPLLGGVAVIIAFFISVSLVMISGDYLWQEHIVPKHILGMFLGSVIILIGGVLDDVYDLKPGRSIIAPVVASLIALSFGLGIRYVTNPLGGILDLGFFQITLVQTETLHLKILLFADTISLFWLLGMSYTTKLLDGVDGLVTGLGTIGAFIIFFMSLYGLPAVQPSTAYLSIIFAGVLAGFLLLNFNPARIFIGEAGSLWVGFMLGILAIISGSKIATAFLIMGLPILDVVWIIFRRAFVEKKSPFRTSDRKHLHHRLLDAGLTQRQVVSIYYFFAILFGGAALFLQSTGKVIVIVLLLLTMSLLISLLLFIDKRHTWPLPPK